MDVAACHQLTQTPDGLAGDTRRRLNYREGEPKAKVKITHKLFHVALGAWFRTANYPVRDLWLTSIE